MQLSKTLLGITNFGINSSISIENEKALSTAYTEFGVGYSHSLFKDKLHLGFGQVSKWPRSCRNRSRWFY